METLIFFLFAYAGIYHHCQFYSQGNLYGAILQKSTTIKPKPIVLPGKAEWL